jgi:DNA-binding MarR family transcriptional regulator
MSLCEDSIFRQYGLTTEQFAVLAAVRSRGGSVRIVDLVDALERSANSVSMLVDRMVAAGLVRRMRDRSDRRAVRVSLTVKGETAIGPAMPAGWGFAQKILSPLSNNDKSALVSMLETVKCEALGYLNPEVDKVEIRKRSPTNRPGLYERMVKNVLPSDSEGKRGSGKKKEGQLTYCNR